MMNGSYSVVKVLEHLPTQQFQAAMSKVAKVLNGPNGAACAVSLSATVIAAILAEKNYNFQLRVPWGDGTIELVANPGQNMNS